MQGWKNTPRCEQEEPAALSPAGAQPSLRAASPAPLPTVFRSQTQPRARLESAKAKGQARSEAAKPFSRGSWGSASSVLALPRLRCQPGQSRHQGWAGPARGLSSRSNGEGGGRRKGKGRAAGIGGRASRAKLQRAGRGGSAAYAGAALAPSGGGAVKAREPLRKNHPRREFILPFKEKKTTQTPPPLPRCGLPLPFLQIKTQQSKQLIPNHIPSVRQACLCKPQNGKFLGKGRVHFNFCVRPH